MPSFWPWKGDQNSAESFERTLSALAQKISKNSANNEALRQRSRRLKVSWTIYGGFTYILTALIFILVTGWQNWGAMEYSTVAGGPLVLWGVRRLLTLWYDYRISNTQATLDTLNKERDSTIDKLKAATKYDSTQQLIDKYSSKPSSPKTTTDKRKSQGGPSQPPERRVFQQPPPTANIPRGNVPPQSVPSGVMGKPLSQVGPIEGARPFAPPQPRPASPVTEEFAPNAFSEPSRPSALQTYGESTWYDRILDALLGEDETSAKNRFALICSHCRLVNGQAPPGARTVEDVGKWRCSGCGHINGVENVAAKLVNEVKRAEEKQEIGTLVGEEASEGEDEGEGDGSGVEVDADAMDLDTPAKATRSKTKGQKGKK